MPFTTSSLATKPAAFHQSQPHNPYQPHQVYQHPQPTTTSLNPSVSSFHPTTNTMSSTIPNTMLAPYRLPPTPESPRTTNTANHAVTPWEMQQMQRYVLTTHFDHTKEMAGLHREIRDLKEVNEDIIAAFTRDMRTLQGQIAAQGKRMGAWDAGDVAVSRAEQVKAPPKEWLESFSRDRIAEVYLEEAEDYEEAARRLREEAGRICAPVAKDWAERRATPEMSEHVQSTHGSLETANEHSVAGSEGEAASIVHNTPTHMPARRAKPSNTDEQAEAEDVTTAEYEVPGNKAYVPLAVLNMPTFTPPTSATSHTKIFSWELLTEAFGGTQHSPGFYWVPESKELKSYWLLEGKFEPYVPTTPGRHGARITAIFNESLPEKGQVFPDETNYLKVPVFVRAEGEDGYRYMGNYSQLRFSDKLDYERCMKDVPEKVRQYWATQLSDPTRPQWVTDALMKHFWPPPTYSGLIPKDSRDTSLQSSALDAKSGLETKVQRALERYAEQMKTWKQDAEMRVKMLNAEALMKAFGAADADEEPGLRLWWEYLQCEGYDEGFYEKLVGLKRDAEVAAAQGKLIRKVRNVEVSGPKTVGWGPNTRMVTEDGRVINPLTGEETGPYRAKEETQAKNAMEGDLEAAKKMQRECTRAQQRKPKASGPPHLRK